MAAAIRAHKRLLAVAAVSAIAAFLCAVVNSGVISGFPPKLDLNHLQIAAATAHVNVDLPSPYPSLLQRRGDVPQDQQTMIKRGELLGRMMVTEPVLGRIESTCHIPAGQLSGVGRTTANVPIAFTEPPSERRASEIEASRTRYRLEMQARPLEPTIDLYAQAPTVAEAACVADSATPALESYLRDLAKQQGSPISRVMRLSPLGPAQAGVANGGATITIAVLTFVTIFGLCFVALLTLTGLLRRGSRPRRLRPEDDDRDDPNDSWPNTTRLLPWLFAGFLALIWLTPFNNIQLDASLPIELRLDRLVLPIVVAVWVLALGLGGRIAPRLRLTWVHVAIAGLLGCAFLSVVTDARYLNHSLELDLSLKKLPLMLSYATLFLIASSSVRRREVHAFMTFTLGLAVVVAFGMLIEYRLKYNPFWSLSDKLLPGFFSINGVEDGGAVDHIGRRLVRGSAEVPLEAVAMLTMALPIALIRAIHASSWRQRLIYGAAICLLAAATFATYRKSAFIIPVSVVVALAYFRRHELLRLAPLGLITVVAVSVIAPGTIGPTIRQFTRSDATALPTVSDRSSDYDAVRPDVLSHLALGRGWGSYNHESYRILDSEILQRLIETGVLGLLTFLLVGVAVVASSIKTIAARDPDRAPIALIGALVTVAFFVATFLFDELSFPHAAYIFLYMIGLSTVVIPRIGEGDRQSSVPPALKFAPVAVKREQDAAVEAPLVPAR